jgi:hypothetical protein
MKRSYKTVFLGLLPILLTLWGVPLYASSQKQPKDEAQVKVESGAGEPSPLKAIEQSAEQVVVLAANENWKQVDQKVNEIQVDWLDFKPLDPSNSQSESMLRMEYALKQLATVSRQHNRLVTVLAANEVSSTVMDVYTLYNPILPGAVERLDEQQRRIILDAALGQFQDASRELEGARRIWYFFKPAVEYNGGDDVSDDFQVKLDLEEEFIHSKQRSDLLAAAQQAITSLDEVANVFD